MRLTQYFDQASQHKAPQMTRRLFTALIAALVFTSAPITWSQTTPAPYPGDSGRDIETMIANSATGLALPNEPIESDLKLRAAKSTSWRLGKTDNLLLENEVRIAIGSYAFKAERAVVLITQRQTIGRVINDVVVYLDHVSEIGGQGPTTQQAKRLLVTATLIGKVDLTTDLMITEPAFDDELVTATYDRLKRYRDNIRNNTVPLEGGEPLVAREVFVDRAQRRADVRGQDADTIPEYTPRVATHTATTSVATLPQTTPTLPAPPATPTTPTTDTPATSSEKSNDLANQFEYYAGRIVTQTDEQGDYAMLIGDIQTMYTDPKSGQRITLTADKAVIFFKAGTIKNMSSAGSPSEAVLGVYLEDNVVVTNGDYTMRGPRVFYEPTTNQAVVLDAVLYTWDPTIQTPLYVRAAQLRQHSLEQWSASNAKFTTSAFNEPHFAIGVEKLTVTEKQNANGTVGHVLHAKNTSFDVGGHSLFYWPSMSGSPTDIPIKSLNVGYDSERGAYAESSWDIFTMLGKEKPQGVEAEFLVDTYTKRGFGLGIESDYDIDNAFGLFEAYYLFDQGEDEPGGRMDVTPSTENRGRLLLQHKHQLSNDWEATAEIAWLSDPNFLEEFLQTDANTAKEYETLLYLKQQRDDWAFTALAKTDLQDFVATTDLLQTRGNGVNTGDAVTGYTTEKLPELAYWRVGTPLWENRLTWYSENRASVMRLNLPTDTLSERGFTAAEATALFGASATTSLDDQLRSTTGLSGQTRSRFDTRQEIQAPLQLGSINLTPYAIGRITAYDDDFNEYSATGEGDNTRFWGGAGVKAHTSYSKSYNTVNNEILDIHRLRHIIEPSANAFYADTNLHQQDLPIYDYDVEQLSDDGMIRLGLRNTLQTQRGGPGRWRNVDFLRVDTDFVFTEEDQIEHPIARFFDYRPEMSQYGDHFWGEAAWQVTDTFAMLTNVNYGFERDRVERYNFGFTLDHTPRLTSFAQYRQIQAVDEAIVRYGFDYMLTPKYFVRYSQTYDLDAHQNRNITMYLTRRLPSWLMTFVFDVDTIDDSTSVGVALTPEGTGSGRADRNPFMMR